MCFASALLAEPLRVAVYHTELSRDGPGLLLRDILKADAQVEAVVRVVQAADADVLVLADIDYDLTHVALNALADRIGGYPHRFARRPNRGLASGRDLDGDGRIGGPDDAEGYAEFSGQGGLAILSRLPLDMDRVRDFTAFAWADLPGNIAPGDGRDPSRLGRTGHWDVPVILEGGQRVHILTWHATAPVFDGPEDRNGRRNHDEAAFWLAYLDGQLADPPPEDFVLAGVANADPVDGESRPAALRMLLERLQDTRPESAGGVLAAAEDGAINATHRGGAQYDTADWEEGPRRPGNLRVDYVLPAPHLKVLDSGVFWPLPDALLGDDVRLASRHRLVWVDIEVPDRTGHGG